MELWGLKLGYEKEDDILVNNSFAADHFGSTGTGLTVAQ